MVTIKNHNLNNSYIRGMVGIVYIEDKVVESRLRTYGQVNGDPSGWVDKVVEK